MINSFEKILVMDAFSKSWGLQDSLKTAIKTKDQTLYKTSVETLAKRAGVRIVHIEKNINQIIKY